MKSKKTLPLILTCIVAVAIAGVTAVLAVKAKNQTIAPIAGEVSGYTENTSEQGTTELNITAEELSTEVNDESTIAEGSTVTETVSGVLTTIVEGAESTTNAVSTAIATTVASVNAEFYKVFSLPSSPKYVVKESKVDYNTASLASYKYSPSGNYYYTDDKNAWQKGFGYTQTYDKLALVAAMYYDTVRNTFSYGGKEWLVQFWKGQYGYYFVGGEIGVYTRTGSGNYACADKSDWVNMEMTFMWDEDHNGNYKPIFTRPYGQYWWCTGFVIGFETSASLKSRQQFRIVAHIQFKDTEMANAFCAAMAKNGFTEVDTLNSSKLDSFVRVGPDVGFVWQNINQHVI